MKHTKEALQKCLRILNYALLLLRHIALTDLSFLASAQTRITDRVPPRF